MKFCNGNLNSFVPKAQICLLHHTVLCCQHHLNHPSSLLKFANCPGAPFLPSLILKTATAKTVMVPTHVCTRAHTPRSLRLRLIQEPGCTEQREGQSKRPRLPLPPPGPPLRPRGSRWRCRRGRPAALPPAHGRIPPLSCNGDQDSRTPPRLAVQHGLNRLSTWLLPRSQRKGGSQLLRDSWALGPRGLHGGASGSPEQGGGITPKGPPSATSELSSPGAAKSGCSLQDSASFSLSFKDAVSDTSVDAAPTTAGKTLKS